MLNDSQIKLLTERKNSILATRESQLTRNQLGAVGGHPYVSATLQPFPNENPLDFGGGRRYDGSTVIGRKDYTPAVNYLGKIVSEITNFTFLNPPMRSGANESIVSNINGSQDSVDTVMKRLNDYFTVNGWAWLKIDIPRYDTSSELSIADKESLGIRPFWYAVNPLNVVDWSADRFGIRWVLEEDYEQLTEDPLTPSAFIRVRRLWEPGFVHVIRYVTPSDRRKKLQFQVETIETGLNRVPFVLMGTPSANPWEFDTYESINATILNLESSNIDIFINVAFPTQYVNENTVERLYQQQLSKFTLSQGNNNTLIQVDESKALDAAFNLALGTKRPIVLGTGDSPFYAQMPTGLDQIRDEIKAQVDQLMNISGVLVHKDKSIAQSGVSQAFDLLTIQSTVYNRAHLLQNVERTAVQISQEWDPDYTGWTVEYNGNIIDALRAHAEEAQETANSTTENVTV